MQIMTIGGRHPARQFHQDCTDFSYEVNGVTISMGFLVIMTHDLLIKNLIVVFYKVSTSVVTKATTLFVRDLYAGCIIQFPFILHPSKRTLIKY